MSKPKIIPAIDLFLPSVEIIKNNLLAYFVLSVMPSLMSILGTKQIKDPTSLMDQIKTITPLSMTGSILAFAFFAPLIFLLVQTTKGRTVSLSEALTKGYKYFFRLLGLMIVFIILMMIGFVLFVIPGIIVIRRYFLSFYYLVDQDLSIKDAMRKSANTSKQNSFAIYGVMGVMLIFVLFAAIPGISAIIGNIMQFLYSAAPALRYQEMTNLYDNQSVKAKHPKSPKISKA